MNIWQWIKQIRTRNVSNSTKKSEEHIIVTEQKIVDTFHKEEHDYFVFSNRMDWALFDPQKEY